MISCNNVGGGGESGSGVWVFKGDEWGWGRLFQMFPPKRSDYLKGSYYSNKYGTFLPTSGHVKPILPTD